MLMRWLRNGFMSVIYAWFYIPIAILVINSFNQSRFGIHCRDGQPSGIRLC